MGYVHDFPVYVTKKSHGCFLTFFFVHLLWAPSFHTGRRLETEALCGWVGCFVNGGIQVSGRWMAVENIQLSREKRAPGGLG